MLLRGTTLADGTTADVRIEDGLVAEVAPAGTLVAGPRDDGVDLAGHVLLPAFAEPHAHLDKALTVDRFDVPTGDLHAAIAAWHEHRASLGLEDIADRARRAALLAVSHGVTALRTHVDVGEGIELRGAEALVAVRDELRDLLDLQVVALSYPLAGEAGRLNRDLLRGALELGVDVVGGAPHIDADPAGHLDVCLSLAAEFGLPVDLHVDEHLGASADLPELARRVAAGFPHAVTAGHCVSLGMRPAATQDAIAAEVAAAGVAVVSCPQTNLYLQGRDRPTATPRGITALGALLRAGAVVAGGGDNVQDPFNPLGRCDPLHTAQLLVIAGHTGVADAIRMVTDHARAAIGLTPIRVAPGQPADLVAVAGTSPRDALARAGDDRLVLRRGRVVGRRRVITDAIAQTSGEPAVVLPPPPQRRADA